MDKSAAKKDYKQAKRMMGVYRIRNMQSDKSYVGFSTDLPARVNRHKTELKFGSHRNMELLGEWKALGESSFEFEVLDELVEEGKLLIAEIVLPDIQLDLSCLVTEVCKHRLPMVPDNVDPSGGRNPF